MRRWSCGGSGSGGVKGGREGGENELQSSPPALPAGNNIYERDKAAWTRMEEKEKEKE